ncbi:MAG: hypothetical protein EXR33_07620 [Betaproteobacteria bacterium]|nr:hypothetical protein [Betaproteobacteria bacterium]
MNSAKQKLSAGKLVLCMGLRQARSPDIAMIAAECGFDAIYADMQHSPLSLETVSAICVGALPLGEINQTLNAETLIVVMLETPQGIANADEIAAVPGVDVVLIGSNDLCTGLGIPGQLRHPKLRDNECMLDAMQAMGARAAARCVLRRDRLAPQFPAAGLANRRNAAGALEAARGPQPRPHGHVPRQGRPAPAGLPQAARSAGAGRRPLLDQVHGHVPHVAGAGLFRRAADGARAHRRCARPRHLGQRLPAPFLRR